MRECRHLKEQGHCRKDIGASALCPASRPAVAGDRCECRPTVHNACAKCTRLWGTEADPELNYPGAYQHHFKVCEVPRQAFPVLSLLLTQKGMGAQSGAWPPADRTGRPERLSASGPRLLGSRCRSCVAVGKSLPVHVQFPRVKREHDPGGSTSPA